MARYLDEADTACRTRFETIRIAPEQMPLFDDRNAECAWVVGREGPRVLLFNDGFNWLELGWILSNGKIWSIDTRHSMQAAMEQWPVGPISPIRDDRSGRFRQRGEQFKMVVAAYGHLENIESTRMLLRNKIECYLRQADFSDQERAEDPVIILACDTPQSGIGGISGGNAAACGGGAGGF